MLAIRMQRTGRKGHAMFRVIVQDARRTPTSGNVVAQLGHYDPHTKAVTLDKEKTLFYLEHGAQPSERIAQLIRGEKMKLPEWVAARRSKQGKIRNPEKLQKDLPKPAVSPAEAEVSEEVEPAEAMPEVEVTPEAVDVADATPEVEITTEVLEAAEPVTETEVTPEAIEEADVTPKAKPAEPVPDEAPVADKE
jgi:small subunit ribosomal protein S16